MEDAAAPHADITLYQRAGSEEVGNGPSYKGLRIHAFPEAHERVGELIRKGLAPGSMVLDMASGSGAMCLRLHDLGFSPTGCDMVSENFRLHGDIPFVALNLNLRLPTHLVGAFDGVVATDIIEHLENPRQFLRECFHVLRPGGILLLSTPNVDSPYSKALFVRTGNFHWFEESAYRNGGHITPIPQRLLERALDEAGFREVRIESAVAQIPPGLRWWRMKLLTWMVGLAAGADAPRGQTLIVEAKRSAEFPDA